MKPKDLKPPFSWSSRRVICENRLLFVPERLEYNEGPVAFPEIFKNSHPLHIEYCSGNGDWIIEKAEAHPEINWLAVEKRFDRVRKIWSKRENRGIGNLMVACGKAETITEHFIGEETADRLFINFPDPWPKDRHAKHRIFQEPFIEQMARILKKQGDLICVTDDPAYSEQIVKEVLGNSRFESVFEPPMQASWPEYGASYFHDLWLKLGRTISFFHFRKKGTCDV